MKGTLAAAALVVRSKNAGPFELTLDVIFKERRGFERARDTQLINKPLIGRLYGVPEEDVLDIVAFEPANAIKATIKRRLPSAAIGDTDVYGAQQHAPLLGVPFDTEA
ncbi:DUF4387 domain-containing protein [Mesorhizobium sp.]|uniref:DUF4387 domain-containing protein n=1 Tax=Mesorhizobium sp. TaxID=1871066 RepID=UPI000FE59651|nr:DUF4387 domain-containing protein [Mesorhizobium sp.]RWB69960.1 MAG: DUF4387 domain-containing protein [Mesorhizobium sp.]